MKTSAVKTPTCIPGALFLRFCLHLCQCFIWPTFSVHCSGTTASVSCEHKCCIDDACCIHRSSNSSGIIVHCIANDCELNEDHETSTTVTHRSSLCHSTSHKAHRLVVNRSVSKSVYTCTTGWTKRFEYSSAYNK